jgi:hypothetical protein
MTPSDASSWSEENRVEVERLFEVSRELMRQIDAIKRRMAECSADIAARPSDLKKSDIP